MNFKQLRNLEDLDSLETEDVTYGRYKGKNIILKFCSKNDNVGFMGFETPIGAILSLWKKRELPTYSFIAIADKGNVYITAKKRDLKYSEKYGLIVKRAYEDRSGRSPADD